MRAELRRQAIDLSGDICEWPKCERRGMELAHATNIGMGGKHAAADTIENVAWLCTGHARVSDLEPWPGPQGYLERDAQISLLGEAVGVRLDWKWSQYEVARALKEWLRVTRFINE